MCWQPVLLGSCGIPLKSILKSDDLHLTRELEIRELGRNGSFSSSGRNTSLNSSRSAAGAPLLGTLKVGAFCRCWIDGIWLVEEQQEAFLRRERLRNMCLSASWGCILGIDLWLFIAEKPLAFSNLSDFDLFASLVWLACGFFFSCSWSVMLIVTDEGDDNGKKYENVIHITLTIVMKRILWCVCVCSLSSF